MFSQAFAFQGMFTPLGLAVKPTICHAQVLELVTTVDSASTSGRRSAIAFFGVPAAQDWPLRFASLQAERTPKRPESPGLIWQKLE